MMAENSVYFPVLNNTGTEHSFLSQCEITQKICKNRLRPWSPGNVNSWKISSGLGEGNGTPLQYSCLENPMDRGAWWAAVHGIAKSRTRLSDSTFTFSFMHWRRKWQPTPVFLPGESQAQGNLVGCRLQGRTESDTTEVT